ncbi:MAG: LysR family transcriptional regulator [Parasporobacterium sp.]|nr:LysR family transcriptional regulator [Parasporobacterium sp.]
MNINSLKYFITLAEQLHFGRAADMLYISQSTLSYHINELENELGIKLFTRNNRKVLLSSTGAAILPLAKKIVEESSDLQKLAAEANRKTPDVAKLNLCFDACFERFDLLGIPAAISKLRKENPGIDISISLTGFDDLISGTASMKYDIGIGILKPKEKTSQLLNVLPLFDDQFAIVYYPSEPDHASPDEVLSGAKVYLIDEDERWTETITNALVSNDISREPILLKNFSDILTHVVLGEGVTIMPKTQAEIEALTRPGMHVLALDYPDFNMRICAFWAKDNYNYAITQLLSEIEINPAISDILW